MSLSSEPALSILKKHFICGVRDISEESYAGVSGVHTTNGQAIDTTNGAGPHNLQLFILSPDGIVLTCLPGYWHSQDLVREMNLAQDLYKVWQDPTLNRFQKNNIFTQMHLSHINQHPQAMVRRSRMQGFDQKYEANHRLYESDTISNPQLIESSYTTGMDLPKAAFKTTDVIMHQRMAKRPFVPFNQFDIAAYVDYGRPKYDKHEDERNPYTGKRMDNSNSGNSSLINGNGQDKTARKQARQLKRARRQAKRNSSFPSNPNFPNSSNIPNNGVTNYGWRN